MVKVQRFADMAAYVGKELGVSQWVVVSQRMIDQFGDVTGDRHWIHTDPVRAKAEGPFGNTVAHGYLTLSLVTHLLEQCFQVASAKRWTNYGLDKVRFTSAVLPDQKLRLRLALGSCEARDGGAMRLMLHCTMEVEGTDRPAMVAEFLTIGYE